MRDKLQMCEESASLNDFRSKPEEEVGSRDSRSMKAPICRSSAVKLVFGVNTTDYTALLTLLSLQ